jgi:HSP90 family molecular chaperone
MPDTTHEFDLQPDPRILPMLGEINPSQWKCLAELIDNSVDAFLEMIRAGQTPTHPEIAITVPTTDTTTAKVTVRDNGPGMSREKLEMAVRAGWSGSDPTTNLGLFGMGFNIATARLGTVTTAWTTRESDTEWIGLRIDFDALRGQRHFKTPELTRPKIDPSEHGTEITVERLKPEQRMWFTKADLPSAIWTESRL